MPTQLNLPTSAHFSNNALPTTTAMTTPKSVSLLANQTLPIQKTTQHPLNSLITTKHHRNTAKTTLFSTFLPSRPINGIDLLDPLHSLETTTKYNPTLQVQSSTKTKPIQTPGPTLTFRTIKPPTTISPRANWSKKNQKAPEWQTVTPKTPLPTSKNPKTMLTTVSVSRKESITSKPSMPSISTTPVLTSKTGLPKVSLGNYQTPIPTRPAHGSSARIVTTTKAKSTSKSLLNWSVSTKSFGGFTTIPDATTQTTNTLLPMTIHPAKTITKVGLLTALRKIKF